LSAPSASAGLPRRKIRRSLTISPTSCCRARFEPVIRQLRLGLKRDFFANRPPAQYLWMEPNQGGGGWLLFSTIVAARCAILKRRTARIRRCCANLTGFA